jgi:hypothetical protein
MNENPLSSLTNYSRFVVEWFNRPTIEHSTVIVWSSSTYTGVAEGEVFFLQGLKLRLREELDFDACIIASYGYELYKNEKRLWWYDDFPHPNDLELASTFPHHKHVPPDIKRNRIPAPLLSFVHPNIPVLIQEIEELLTRE